MAFTQDFFTQRRNFGDGNVRIGEQDRLWYDSHTNTIRISDGVTPGGVIVGNASVSLPANISYFYNDVGYLTSSTGVSSIVASVGISVTAPVGNVGISNTGILSVTGTPNQITVFNNGANNLTLSLPQNFDTHANVTLANLVVTNLTVLGNTYIETPSTIVGTRLYLGNTATSNAAINGGGIYLGNSASGITRSITFDQSSNSWIIDGLGTGITTGVIYSGNINAASGRFTDGVHMGAAYEGYDYPDAILQIDSNVNSYSQVISQNHFTGVGASSDFVAVNDIGNDTSHYIDVGINSSVYTDPNYTATKPNDGYVYVNSGNLVIGVDTTSKQIVFTAGGMKTANVIGTANSSGWYLNSATISTLHATTQYLTENTNLFYTDARARHSVSASGNISYNESTGVFSYNQPANVSAFYNDALYVNISQLNSSISTTHDFGQVAVNGQTINASISHDTLTFASGNNISVTANTSTKTVTVTGLYGNANVKAFLNGIDLENTYLAAQDNTTQYQNANVRLANPITVGTTDFSSNIINSNGNITLINSGIYNLQFSAQVVSTSTATEDVYIWLRQNGVDVPNSAGQITMQPRQNSNTPTGIISTWNYFIKTTNPNEFVQLYWWSNGGNSITLADIAAQSANLNRPAIPQSPSIILTISPVRIN